MAADLAKLMIEVDSRQVRTANRDLDALERRGESVENRFTSMGRTAQGLGRSLSTFLTAPLLAAGGMAVKTAADYETLQTNLEVLVGSAEVAKTVFDDLTDFAATTPFEIDGIVRANNLLIQMGLSIEDTQRMLSVLGDIAAVSGGDLFQMARITGEARAEGKLLTRDLRQLIGQGVPIIQLLAESMGVAENQIFELAESGKIGFEELTEAMREATEEGGLYFEGMETLSSTLSGIFSNFFDSVNQSLSSFGQNLIDTLDIKDVMRGLVEDIESATQWFDELDDSTQRMIISFGLLLAAIGPVIGILGTLSLAIGAISTPVLAVVGVIGVGTAAIITYWEDVEAYFTTGGGAEMWESLQNIVKDTVKIVTGLWDQFGDGIMNITTESFGIVFDIIETTLKSIESLVGVFSSAYDGEYEKAFMRAESGWRDHMGNVKGIVERGLLLLRDFDVVGGYKIWEALGLIPSSEELQQRYEERMQQALDKARQIEAPEDNVIDIELDLEGIESDLGGAIRDMSLERITIPGESIFNEGLVSSWSAATDKALEDINRKFKTIETSASIFSDFDENAVKVQTVETALKDLIDQGVNPNSAGMLEIIALYNRLESEGNKSANELNQDLQEVNQTAVDLGFTFSSAFEDAIVSGNSFREVLDGIFQDLLRISTRALITEPLGNAFADYIGGIDLFGGTSAGSGSTGGSSSGFGVFAGMEMANSTAGMTANPTNGGSGSVNVNVYNQSGAEVEVQERQNANGGVDMDIMIRRAVQGLHNSGQMDSTMSRNYGVSRRARSRG